MVQGADGKWRTMANEKLASKMLIGALYRCELARELGTLGYGIEKTHADGRFEIAGVPRKVIDAFSNSRRAIFCPEVSDPATLNGSNGSERLIQRLTHFSFPPSTP